MTNKRSLYLIIGGGAIVGLSALTKVDTPDGEVSTLEYGAETVKNTVASLFQDQKTAMARNIYYEARNQSDEGQAAVGYVVLNRVNDSLWPDTPKAVIYQPYQFSWANGDILRHAPIPKNAAYAKAEMIAEGVLNGRIPNPIGSANHYYADYIQQPSWAKNMLFIRKIGNHLFYNG